MTEAEHLAAIRDAALDYIAAVQSSVLSHDAVLIDFPLEVEERLLSLLAPDYGLTGAHLYVSDM